MTACPQLERCPFLHQAEDSMPSLAGVYRRVYCQGCYNSCARFKVHVCLGPQLVPNSLFPNQTWKADTLIRRG